MSQDFSNQSVTSDEQKNDLHLSIDHVSKMYHFEFKHKLFPFAFFAIRHP